MPDAEGGLGAAYIGAASAAGAQAGVDAQADLTTGELLAILLQLEQGAGVELDSLFAEHRTAHQWHYWLSRHNSSMRAALGLVHCMAGLGMATASRERNASTRQRQAGGGWKLPFDGVRRAKSEERRAKRAGESVVAVVVLMGVVQER